MQHRAICMTVLQATGDKCTTLFGQHYNILWTLHRAICMTVLQATGDKCTTLFGQHYNILWTLPISVVDVLRSLAFCEDTDNDARFFLSAVLLANVYEKKTRQVARISLVSIQCKKKTKKKKRKVYAVRHRIWSLSPKRQPGQSARQHQ